MRWMPGVLGMVLALGGAGAMRAQDQFMKPTPEELSMTSLPGYPGAAAVVLYREETDRSDLFAIQHYERIKILTNAGKRYANVELPFTSMNLDSEGIGTATSVDDISGRTIHPDGTVVPFTGKPYLKVIENEKNVFGDLDVKRQERVFTLPDVEVGSIIEFRYAVHWDHFFSAPDWFIQGDLYVKAAHYTWYPSGSFLESNGRELSTISWFPLLPPGAKLDHHEIPAPDHQNGVQQIYELKAQDIPPVAHEEYMPPVENYSYRVLFSYTPYNNGAQFWEGEGKEWSKRVDSFMNVSSVREATAKITAGAATDDEKLQKIYAAVMALDNTKFSREHGQQENKAAGVGKVSSVHAVLELGRGTPDQLTELFVAMVRAVGMKAYLAAVPDRSKRLFTQGWLDLGQLEAPIAIVNVGGKDRFFDPGERYCSFGHLAWQHTLVQGLRQTDHGADFTTTPADGYAANKTIRIANLKLDAIGQVSGTIDITFTGAAALRLRQAALRSDEEGIHGELRKALEATAPKSMDVKVSSIEGLTDYEQPLVVHYEIGGTLGTAAGKRLMLPVNLFEARSSATFPDEKRETPVYFHFPQAMQDAVRINVDPALQIEAVPDSSRFDIPNLAVYNTTVSQSANSFTLRRQYIFGDVIVPVDQYAKLRTFYSQLEAKDQESVVLKQAPSSASSGSPGPAISER